MKHILPVLFALSLLAQTKNIPQKQQQPLTITLVSVQKMNVGEAYDCPSIDMQWLEAHCFRPTKENLNAPKHKYLVKVTFDKPVETDSDGWAWDFTCRLDSYKAATCQVNKQTQRKNQTD